MADLQDVGSSAPTLPDNPPARTVIADHVLLQRIGEGSYGEVWLAQNVFGEFRAVKIVHRRRFQEQRPYEREFRGIQKFEPISRAHESQVDILHVGRDDLAGYFYYIMEPADDLRSGQAIKPEIYCPKTLKNVLVQQERLSFAETLHIGLNLVAALEHLHQHNLVHRDIKPSNIIFIGGIPRLADIGLVAEISEARSFVGTEGFIPPEGPGTVQADIYSLGKVLYLCCLAQRDKPFPELPDNFEELPDKARLLELNEIILKCCETDLRARYKSAGAMRADLLLLQGGKSVKRLRLVERRLALITRASIVMTCLAVLTSALAFQISRQKTATTQRLVRSHVDAGTRLMNDGDYFGALLWFAEALKLDAGNPIREENHRIRIASVLRQCPKLVGVFVHDGTVNQAAFSPDGRHLATASDDHTAAIWDLVSGARLFTLPHKNKVYLLAFSPDGTRIATADRDDMAHVWDAATGKPLLVNLKHRRVHGGGILRFSPDGQKLVTFPETDAAQVWDLVSGQSVGTALRHRQDITSLAFNPDGKQILTTSGQSHVWLWDTATGAPVPLEIKGGGRTIDACFNPNGRSLATTSDDGCLRLWTYPGGQFLPPLMRHHHWIQSLCFSPEGDRLLSTAQDKTAQIWSAATHNSLVLPLLHAYPLLSGEFTPDGRAIVTASAGIYARVWNAVTGEPLSPPLKHSRSIRPGNISPDGHLIVTINGDQTSKGDQAVRVWDMANVEPLTMELTPVFHPHQPISPNGRLKVSFGRETAQDSTARVLEVISGRPTTPPLRHNGPLRQALFSADSKLLVTETLDSSARVWDPETGEALGPALHTKYVPGGRIFGGHVGELRWPTKKDLPHDSRPIADLVRVAELMSGNRIDSWGGLVPLDIKDVTNYWALLRASDPTNFSSSTPNSIAWHEHQARCCESDCDWWAARFHLDQLIKLQPGDTVVRARRAYAQLALDTEMAAAITNSSGRPIIPPRDPVAPANLIDLSACYNDSLQENRGSSVEISDSPIEFPMGLQTLAGTQFDVRGVVQLSRKARQVDIKIGQKCHHLHFLHAARNWARDGTEAGKYVVHFAGGQEKEIPVLYGRDVRAWRMGAGTAETFASQPGAVIAWMGLSPAARANVEVLRIFKSTWENPFENQVITSIDFTDGSTDAEPFLLGLTLD